MLHKITGKTLCNPSIIFYLTNCARCGIMEKRAQSNVGAPRKLSNRRIESVDNFEFLFVNLAFPDGFLSRMLCHQSYVVTLPGASHRQAQPCINSSSAAFSMNLFTDIFLFFAAATTRL